MEKLWPRNNLCRYWNRKKIRKKIYGYFYSFMRLLHNVNAYSNSHFINICIILVFVISVMFRSPRHTVGYLFLCSINSKFMKTKSKLYVPQRGKGMISRSRERNLQKNHKLARFLAPSSFLVTPLTKICSNFVFLGILRIYRVKAESVDKYFRFKHSEKSVSAILIPFYRFVDILSKICSQVPVSVFKFSKFDGY